MSTNTGSTSDSEDPETEIHVTLEPQQKPAQNCSKLQSTKVEKEIVEEKEDKEEKVVVLEEYIDLESECIFPFIDLTTAGNEPEDWEIFNILCGVPENNKIRNVSLSECREFSPNGLINQVLSG